MKIIVCSGDSHTWGEGATGLLEAFTPPAVPGEPRVAPFYPPCYVNLLREALCGGFAEVRAKDVGGAFDGNCAAFTRLELPFGGSFVRVQLRCHADGGVLRLICDGEPAASLDTRADPETYRFASFRCASGAHTLTLEADGTAYFYRMETFAGETAVLNSGVGSCPSVRFLRDFWESHVEAYEPSWVVMEAHSINDWIAQTSIAVCTETLRALCRRTRALGAEPVLVTVPPVTEEQYFGASGIAFGEYVEATREAARAEGVRLADVHAAFVADAAGCADDAAYFSRLCHDKWHPNDRGHRIYADVILAAMR